MVNKQSVVSGLSVFIFLLAAFFPSAPVRSFVDSLVGRIVLLGFLLYAIRLGSMTGILAFLAVAALFVERNRYSIFQAKNYIVSRGSAPTLGEMAPHDTPAPVDGQVKDPSWVGHGSMEDVESWTEVEHGQSEDHKEVIQSQLFPNSRINAFYEDHGLAPRND
jgi:hypothetical protein